MRRRESPTSVVPSSVGLVTESELRTTSLGSIYCTEFPFSVESVGF